jgi:hypothetical protein
MKKSKFGLVVFLVIFGILAFMSIYTVRSMTGNIRQDEYVFEKITSELPKYGTNVSWIAARPELMPIEWTLNNYANWGVKVWIHPPLSYYLYYPIEKLGEAHSNIFNLNSPADIRVVPLVLMLGTVLLFADIIRRRWNWILAGLSLLPMLFSRILVYDGLWLNYEGFMWLFFAVSFWLVIVKPKGWKWEIWISLCAMITCKEVSVALLPVVIAVDWKWSNCKYLLSGLVLVPWIGYGAIVNGNILWLLQNGVGIGSSYSVFGWYRILQSLILYGTFGWLAFVVTGIGVSIRWIKQYLPYLLLLVITVVYGFAWGRAVIAYELYGILYSGMFMVAIGFGWIYKYMESKDKNKIKELA